MMFRKLSEAVFVSAQVEPSDIAQTKELGVRLIVNNRPDNESDDQTPGSEIEKAALLSDMKYLAIPVTQAGFSETQVKAMANALGEANGPILAYCRSGTRSTLLWSLAEASRGGNPQEIADQAASAGYDVSSVRMMIDMLSASA